MNAKQRTRIQVAVNKLIAAEIADSWAGTSPPEDLPIIKRELREARDEYYAALQEVTTP